MPNWPSITQPAERRRNMFPVQPTLRERTSTNLRRIRPGGHADAILVAATPEMLAELQQELDEAVPIP